MLLTRSNQGVICHARLRKDARCRCRTSHRGCVGGRGAQELHLPSCNVVLLHPGSPPSPVCSSASFIRALFGFKFPWREQKRPPSDHSLTPTSLQPCRADPLQYLVLSFTSLCHSHEISTFPPQAVMGWGERHDHKLSFPPLPPGLQGSTLPSPVLLGTRARHSDADSATSEAGVKSALISLNRSQAKQAPTSGVVQTSKGCRLCHVARKAPFASYQQTPKPAPAC